MYGFYYYCFIAQMKEKDEEIENLQDSVDELQNTLNDKDLVIKELNEKYESVLTKSLDETTLCAKLQEQVALLEKQLKDIQVSSSNGSSEGDKTIVIYSPTLYSLLNETQQQVKESKSAFIKLKKEYDTVFHPLFHEVQICRERDSLKEEIDELHKLYDDVVRRETDLQGINRQLRNKALAAESRLVELSNSDDFPGSSLTSSDASTNGTGTIVQSKLKEDVLRQENTELVELLTLLSGMTSIPFMGVGNVREGIDFDDQILEYLESERLRLICCCRDERCRRRDLEEQLSMKTHDYEQLQLAYEQLNSPVEEYQFECSFKQETDVATLQDMLEVVIVNETKRQKKCGELATLRNQLQTVQEEKESAAQSVYKLYSMNISSEEIVKQTQDELQYKDLMVNKLTIERDELQKEKDAYGDELYRLQKVVFIVGNKQTIDEIEDLKSSLSEKEKIIADLKKRLESTENFSDLLEMDMSDLLFQAPSKEAEEISQLKDDIEKRKEMEAKLEKSLENLGNTSRSFLYALCDFCLDNSIDKKLADSVQKRITHMNISSEDYRFVDELIQTIEDALQLVDVSLNDFMRDYDTKYRNMIESNKNSQDQIRKLYQRQIDLYKNRIQELEDTNNTDTCISLSLSDMKSMNDSSNDNYLKRQCDNLECANEIYLKQIDELSTRLQSLMERTPIPSSATTIITTDYDGTTNRYQLDKEKAEKTLWKVQAERLEILYARAIKNESCLTDYELSVLAEVINSLYNYVIESLYLDLNLSSPLDHYKNEYNTQVRDEEEREPMIMETTIYQIQKVIGDAIQYYNGVIYQKELEYDNEREKRFLLERKLKSQQFCLFFVLKCVFDKHMTNLIPMYQCHSIIANCLPLEHYEQQLLFLSSLLQKEMEQGNTQYRKTHSVHLLTLSLKVDSTYQQTVNPWEPQYSLLIQSIIKTKRYLYLQNHRY